MAKPRILFLTGGNPDASFVRADVEILDDPCLVECVETGGPPLRRLVALIHACNQIVFSKVDLVYVWFAAVSYAPVIALVARLAKVPLVIVSGGADVANCPDVQFGDARIWWRRYLVRFALERADVVLAFSASSRREIERFARPRRIEVNAPAIQFRQSLPRSEGDRLQSKPLVITVSSVNALSVRQKGLDTFARAAALLPHGRFVFIGRLADSASVEYLRSLAPSNVEFAGPLSADELQQCYAQARVYAQLSAHEGFGLAAAEARAAGCRVVATDRGSLPEVLGTTAAYVPFGDLRATVAAIGRALDDQLPLENVGADFQARYGRDARRTALLNLVQHLTGHVFDEVASVPGLEPARSAASVSWSRKS